MYEIFLQLLEERQMTPYQLSKATGIAQSTLSDWKNGRCTPKTDKLQTIADFFGVPLEYLLGKKKPAGLPDGLAEDAVAIHHNGKIIQYRIPKEKAALVRQFLDAISEKTEEENNQL